ncbi:MAG: hypothetical protein ACO2PM_26150, partial [Pyrobaculum sp.]
MNQYLQGSINRDFSTGKLSLWDFPVRRIKKEDATLGQGRPFMHLEVCGKRLAACTSSAYVETAAG